MPLNHHHHHNHNVEYFFLGMLLGRGGGFGSGSGEGSRVFGFVVMAGIGIWGLIWVEEHWVPWQTAVLLLIMTITLYQIIMRLPERLFTKFRAILSLGILSFLAFFVLIATAVLIRSLMILSSWGISWYSSL